MALLVCLGGFLVAQDAFAGCCRLVKVDTETASAHVRACDPDAGGACDVILFEGTLGLGDEASVCSDFETIVYQEYSDSEGGFGPLVGARCNGGDVEF